MTMHLAGPYLTTTGKKKGKTKFRNAAAAKKHREEKQDWQDLLQKWSKVTISGNTKKASIGVKMPTQQTPYCRKTQEIPSLNGGIDTAPALKKPCINYTGTLIKGISQMHKSNMVPVFDEQHIIEIARMRR